MWELAFVVGLIGGQSTLHPCDRRPPTVFRYKASEVATLNVGWCAQAVDTNGVPLSEPLGFKLEIEGVATVDLGHVAPQQEFGQNAAGEFYYEVHVTQLAAGMIHIHSYLSSGDSASSEPVRLTLTGRPKPPKGIVIKVPGGL